MSDRHIARKWQIGKVEKVIESKIQNLEADRKEILSKADSVEDDYRKKRKRVVSVLLFVVPLILALFSSSSTGGKLIIVSYSLDFLGPYLLPALIGVIGAGLVFFRSYDSKKDKIHDLIQSLDAAYLSSIRKLDYFRQYYNSETYYYLNFNEDRMNTLFNYASFASMAVRVDIIKPLKNMLDSHYFEIIKGDLCSYYDNANKTMKLGVRTYEHNESSWERNRRDWRVLRPIFKDFFRHNGYRLRITGRIITQEPKSEKPKSDGAEEKISGAPFKSY